MSDFTPLPALLGGVLIGTAASMFLGTHGRVAGISGLFGGVLRRDPSIRRIGLAFVAGLLVTGVVVRFVRPDAYASSWTAGVPLALIAGLLVGVGTQLGNGCTSGHAVCGLSRLSIRSLVATLTFMATAGITVFVVRHLLSGGVAR